MAIKQNPTKNRTYFRLFFEWIKLYHHYIIVHLWYSYLWWYYNFKFFDIGEISFQYVIFLFYTVFVCFRLLAIFPSAILSNRVLCVGLKSYNFEIVPHMAGMKQNTVGCFTLCTITSSNIFSYFAISRKISSWNSH